MSKIILTKCQKNALQDFIKFINNPTQTKFVLSGGAGYGKTTLVGYFLNELTKANELHNILKTEGKITNIKYCASTHKAAKVLSDVVGEPVSTIHNMFSLTRGFDRDTGDEYYFKNPRKEVKFKKNTLLIVEESSMISDSLLALMEKHIPPGCKVLFLGDGYQLPPINHVNSPIFNGTSIGSNLSTAVRFDNQELVDLNIELRQAITENRLPKLKEGNHIKLVSKDEFLKQMIEVHKLGISAKTVAWTNVQVKAYSNIIHKEIFGNDKYNVGQKIVAKTTFGGTGNLIPSQQEMLIEQPPIEIIRDIGKEHLEFIQLVTDVGTITIPKNRAAAMRAIKPLKDNKQWRQWNDAKDTFAEVTNGYSITAHQAQGSTYDYVFADLQNIMRNGNFPEMLRLLYVSLSRARKEIILYGG